MWARTTLWKAAVPWLMAGVCACFVTSAAAQSPQPKVITWGSPSAASVKYFAILGEVVRPGVYSAESDATLQSVVEAAGGLSSVASPSLRIVRGDRGGQAVFYDPNGRDLLQPGDFIVVDMQRRPSFSPAMGAGQNRPDGVWIGLSGVTSRPVVVRLEPQYAYLRTIIEGGLRQSPQLARAARLALPPHMLEFQAATDPLPNGTIIGVPPSLLVQAEIPALPPAIAMSPLASKSTPSLSSLLEPPLPRTVAIDLSATPDFAPPTGVVPNPPGDAAPGAGRLLDRELTANTVPFAANNHVDTAASPASLPAPGSRLATQFAAPPPPKEPSGPVPVDANLTAFEPATDDPANADLVGETVIEPKSLAFNFWQMLGIGGSVASLVGIALGTRHYLDRTIPSSAITGEFRRQAMPMPVVTPDSEMARTESEPAQPVSRPPAIKPIPLSALLKNSIPLETEPAEFPAATRLQRPASSAAVMWRVDEAEPQAAQAPHVDLAAIADPAPILELDAAAPSAIPRPHFRTPPAVIAEPNLSAALSEPAVRQTEIQHEPLTTMHRSSGKTAVEKALAHLQRGRHA